MTYDRYAEKVRRNADRVRWAKKHRIPLGAAGALMIGAVIVLLVCLGLFMTGVYAKNIVYGEAPDYGAKAFLCRADYLFTVTGGQEPTEDIPRAAGEYTVIAETKNPFGQIRTSSCGFVIEKRKCVITVENTEMTYGDRTADAGIRVTASDLADGDRLTDIELDVPEFADADCTVSVKSLRIVSADGEDMTSSYDLTFTTGDLKVLPRKLVVTASSAEREYNGLPLESPSWEITDGSVAERDRINVTITGSITKPGKVGNKITVTLTGVNGMDVTDRYDLKAIPGNLKVLKRRITVETGGLTKEFDGLPASDEKWSLTGGSLVEGDRLSAGKAPVYIRAGKYMNSIPFTVSAGGGEGVSDCYDINFKYGYIEITKRKITIATGSSEKMYDGERMRNMEWKIVSGSLVRGHEAVVEFRAIRDVGTMKNIPQYTQVYGRLNGVHSDLTNCYEVTYDPGTLTVTKRPISIITGSAEKHYDGMPLTCPEFTFAKGSLGLGAYDEFSFGDCAEQTEVGSCRNTFRLLLWYDNNDSTGNYDITYEYGTLTVLPPIPGGDKQGGEDDPGGENDPGGEDNPAHGGQDEENGTCLPEPTIPKNNETSGGDGGVFGKLLTDTNLGCYLRYESYGDYIAGEGTWGDVPFISGDAGQLFATGKFLSHLSRAHATLMELSRTRNLVLIPGTVYPQFEGIDSRIPWNGDYVTGSGGKYEYSLMFADYGSLSALLGLAEEYEGSLTADPEYRKFVYSGYLNVPDAHRKLFTRNAKAAGLDKLSGFDLVRGIADYIRGCAEYDPFFEPCPDDQDPVIWFMRNTRRGVCSHFASAAVLMYRTMGIPARYVTGFYADAYAGIVKTIDSSNGHAWVEVWIDGLGWIPVEVTAGANVDYESGKDNSERAPLIVVDPGSRQKNYDGTPLVPGEIRIAEGTLYEGDYIVFDDMEVTGEQIYVGSSMILHSGFPRIFDIDGEDVTDLYDIIVMDGMLTVNPYEYSDTVIMYPKDVVDLPDINTLFPWFEGMIPGAKETVGLPEQNVIVRSGKCYAFAAGTDRYSVMYDMNADGIPEYIAGIDFEVRTFDNVRVINTSAAEAAASGLIDTSDRTLTMTKGEDGREYISLIVCMADAAKKFDGKPLTCDLVKILSGALREGDVISAKGGSYPVYAGTVPNVCGGITVTDSNGNDVTGDYLVTVYAGTLKITQAELRLSDTGVSVPVDGAVSLDGLVMSDAVRNFPAGYSFIPGTGKAGVNGSTLTGIDIGTGKLKVTYSPIDLNGDGIPEYLGGDFDVSVDITAKENLTVPVTVWIALAVPVLAVGLALVFLRKPLRVRGFARKHRRRR